MFGALFRAGWRGAIGKYNMMITRPLLNASDLAEWARGEGFQDIRPEGWHVSLARTQSRTTRPALVGGEVVVMAGNVGPAR